MIVFLYFYLYLFRINLDSFSLGERLDANTHTNVSINTLYFVSFYDQMVSVILIMSCQQSLLSPVYKYRDESKSLLRVTNLQDYRGNICIHHWVSM